MLVTALTPVKNQVNTTPAVKPVTDPDEELISRVLSGDKEAYRSLFEKHSGRVRAIAFEILKNREDAEDVTQESFVKAYLSLSSFKRESSFYTWLYRIAYNMAVDQKRKRARRGGEHVEYDESRSVYDYGEMGETSNQYETALSSPTPGPHEELHSKEVRARITEVLNKLSYEHRLVVVLREVDGLPYDEIAEITGVPRGTVMSRLHYARKALQAELGDLISDESLVEIDDMMKSKGAV